MANRLQNARDFDPYARGVTIEELQKVRRQLAKVMNQRMVRLEQAKSPITGEAYTFGAYDVMSDYLSEKGRNRFDERLSAGEKKDPMSKGELQKEIKFLQKVEDMASSRVAGMKSIEAKRLKAFTAPNEETGRGALSASTVTNKEFYDFLNSQTYEELSRALSSDIIVEEYDKAADRGVPQEKIREALIEYVEQSKKLSVKGIRKKLRSRRLK